MTEGSQDITPAFTALLFSLLGEISKIIRDWDSTTPTVEILFTFFPFSPSPLFLFFFSLLVAALDTRVLYFLLHPAHTHHG